MLLNWELNIAMSGSFRTKFTCYIADFKRRIYAFSNDQEHPHDQPFRKCHQPWNKCRWWQKSYELLSCCWAQNPLITNNHHLREKSRHSELKSWWKNEEAAQFASKTELDVFLKKFWMERSQRGLQSEEKISKKMILAFWGIWTIFPFLAHYELLKSVWKKVSHMAIRSLIVFFCYIRISFRVWWSNAGTERNQSRKLKKKL